jgi:hypothetical protein
MRSDKLEELIIIHKAEGRRPFFVNCTTGTTVMGCFDPINDIADICQRHDLWMHIDVSRSGVQYTQLEQSCRGPEASSIYKFEFWLMYCLCSSYLLLNQRA